MSEPTQAQIEAAAKALFNEFAGDDAVWRDSHDKEYWLNHAHIALTAAAEVGEPHIEWARGYERGYMEARLAEREACAQVAIETGWTEESEEIAAAIRARKA